jgi:hypothetical protein
MFQPVLQGKLRNDATSYYLFRDAKVTVVMGLSYKYELCKTIWDGKSWLFLAHISPSHPPNGNVLHFLRISTSRYV